MCLPASQHPKIAGQRLRVSAASPPALHLSLLPDTVFSQEKGKRAIILSSMSHSHQGNFPARWAWQTSARNGERRELGLLITPIGSKYPFCPLRCCLLSASGQPAPPDGERGKIADGRLTLTVSRARMKCGEQEHDEGIPARAKAGPTESLSPAGTWSDRRVGGE